MSDEFSRRPTRARGAAPRTDGNTTNLGPPARWMRKPRGKRGSGGKRAAPIGIVVPRGDASADEAQAHKPARPKTPFLTPR